MWLWVRHLLWQEFLHTLQSRIVSSQGEMPRELPRWSSAQWHQEGVCCTWVCFSRCKVLSQFSGLKGNEIATDYIRYISSSEAGNLISCTTSDVQGNLVGFHSWLNIGSHYKLLNYFKEIIIGILYSLHSRKNTHITHYLTLKLLPKTHTNLFQLESLRLTDML